MQMTPAQALTLLKEGNEHFVKAQMAKTDLLAAAYHTSEHGQHPFAFVLSCIDSRSIPNIIFDQGIGDIFVSRVAGNVISLNVLASMEYATEIAGAKLIVIMGHTQCGAVEAACEGGGSGAIKMLLKQIHPAVVTVEAEQHRDNCKDPVLISAIAKQNVINQLHATLKDSKAIAKLIKAHKIELVGALHNLKTGKVSFFNLDGKTL